MESTPVQRRTNAVAEPTRTSRRAMSVASVVELAGWIGVFASFIIGVALIAVKGDPYLEQAGRPYAVAGITLMVGGAINCLMVVMIAAYIKARLELSTQ